MARDRHVDLIGLVMEVLICLLYVHPLVWSPG
jgi:hypothetical protein